MTARPWWLLDEPEPQAAEEIARACSTFAAPSILARSAPWWEQEGAIEEPDGHVEVVMVSIPSEPANDKAVA